MLVGVAPSTLQLLLPAVELLLVPEHRRMLVLAILVNAVVV